MQQESVKSPPIADRSAQQPITTLRGWLDHLAARDLLAVIRPGTSLQFELAAIAKRLDGIKATLFPRPGGHSMPVISGLVSRPQLDRRGDGRRASRCADALSGCRAKSVAVDGSQERCRCRKSVHREVDLNKLLPIPTHNEHDNGAYITAGLLIARNPKTGIQNVSIHRLQVTGPNRLGALLLPRHTHMFFDAAEAAGQPLDVAIVVGVDPLTLLSSQAIAPIDFDELTIAGALHGESLPVVKCMTNDVRVPAEAEIVVEGRLLPLLREMEGPFGEFPQYYGEAAKRHVIEVTAVTHRKDALFHTIVGGGLEHLLLGGIPREATLLAHLQRSFPNVRDVHLALGGVCRYHLYVQLAKRQEGEAKNVMMGAFAGHYDVKQVIVVDEDVDIHNPAEVEWAVATRFQADRDLLIVTQQPGLETRSFHA